MAKIKIDENAVVFFITLLLEIDNNGIKTYDLFQDTPIGSNNEISATNKALANVKEKHGENVRVVAKTCSRLTPKLFTLTNNIN